MIQVVVDDLAFLASDAIVRPVTSRLDATTPAVRRLEKYVFSRLQRLPNSEARRLFIVDDKDLVFQGALTS